MSREKKRVSRGKVYIADMVEETMKELEGKEIDIEIHGVEDDGKE